MDATLPTQAAQSLYIWALEDSDVIRSAAAVFANQYPDCDVQLEFGRDATSQALSDEDIIKNLNTRLLAGEAPDVLFLDGLPIRSLPKLTPKECEVMIALYIDRLPVSEAAAKLGVEPNTVSTHRRNACEKIRNEMEGK